jgi:hypothetical protein
MNKPFQQKYFGLSRLFRACHNLFMNSQTCRLVLSKASFTITNLSRSLSPQTEFQRDKVGRTRNKNSSKEHLVKWGGYDETFNSWVKASDIKKI